MRRLLAVFLCIVITLCCLPCPALAAEPAGPLGESPAPTLLDTGRGYVVYYWYSSAVYYSPDGADWTDLSDRAWVKDAAPYTYLGVGHLGHREFELCWTGTEYMLRQSLLDDPRSVYRRLGDSPRNSVVTFLDEDFQVIGELAFDGPVTAIRHQDGTYYATVAETETAFTREDWAEKDTTFSDVQPNAWYAPYVAVCAEEGLMQGTGDGAFSPTQTVTQAEVMAVVARIHDRMHGGTGVLPEAPIEWGRLTVTRDDGLALTAYYDQDRENGHGWSYSSGGHSDSSYYLLLHADPQLWDTWGAYIPVTLTLGDKEFPTHASAFVQNTLRVFSLEEDNFTYYNEASHHTYAPEPGVWYRDAIYYWKTHQLLGKISSPWPFEEPSTRWETARILLAALDDQIPMDVPGSLPDMDEDPRLKTVLPLYQAGIITGIDEIGHFNPDGVLTRAELATIVARLVRPDLRPSLGAIS